MIIVKEQHIYDADCASCKDKKNEVNATRPMGEYTKVRSDALFEAMNFLLIMNHVEQ